MGCPLSFYTLFFEARSLIKPGADSARLQSPKCPPVPGSPALGLQHTPCLALYVARDPNSSTPPAEPPSAPSAFSSRFHPSAHGFHFLFTSRLSISPVFLFLLTSLLFFLPVCSAGNSWLQPNMCNAWRLMMSRPNTKQKQRNPSPHPTLTLRPPQLRSQAAAAQNSCF